ncbi:MULTISPECIES: energy transducer TonB family protein [Brenneria]|uniref:Protein TonB n=1 Tax=Brenneria nigrifluens DSM 30175 = ATCC 13028 TaxID=1121120 RepID=A0A2U1UGW4_9GAMM|nr:MULTISPECIES: energy transducer TonB [Brenneria]EHD19967.1 TonB family protein [Brenneria sp. EniD312]PWC20901.1 energy transducer TonB [Brenneria nigrifluens] [Brenneria nigrifluens DSM 30175 = ATCC 13028]QCR03211.1 energy transducer TonB [Brenneria nigrifluens] [Brenneria nigrifluens DSM 30175 = ATCC 13028]
MNSLANNDDGLVGAARWSCASLLALAFHSGGILWMLHEPPMAAADSMPPASIMIELADMPQAAATDHNEISTERQDSQASQAAEKVKTPKESPPEPQEDMPQPQTPEPLKEPRLERNDRAALKVPAARKPPPKPKTQTERAKRLEDAAKPRQQQQAASRQTVRAQAQVAPSERTAARQSTAGASAASATSAKWQARLMAHLERRKKYPPGARARGEVGTVFIRFSIDDAGNVLDAQLARSSGFAELDREVLALVRRASPVPAPPAGMPHAITAPVRFSVRDR